MIKNEMNREDVKRAFKMWATKCDGYGGAVGGIFGEIPYGEEIEALCPWDDVVEEFDEIIGTSPDFDIEKIVCGNIEEHRKLEDWAYDKSCKMWNYYDKFINRLNSRNKEKVIIYLDVGIVNGVVKYKILETIAKDSKYEAILEAYNKHGKYNNWNIGAFFDAMYKGNRVAMGCFSAELVK